MHTLYNMFLVVAVWSLLFFSQAGIGFFFKSALYLDPASREGWMRAFWTGMTLTLVYLEAWHLFLPVNLPIGVALLLCGSLSAAFFVRRVRPGQFRRFGFQLLLLLPFLLWFANRALDIPVNYDSGLYHFPTIHWLNDFPLVPGLANVFGRLGFNEAYFLYPAFANAFFPTPIGYHFVNGLFLAVLTVQLGCRLVTPRAAVPAPGLVFDLLLFPIVVRQGSHNNICCPTPDLPVFLLGILMFSTAVHFLFSRSAARQNRRGSLLYMALLFSLGYAMKLGIAAIAGTLLIFCIVDRLRIRRSNRQTRCGPFCRLHLHSGRDVASPRRYYQRICGLSGSFHAIAAPVVGSPCSCHKRQKLDSFVGQNAMCSLERGARVCRVAAAVVRGNASHRQRRGPAFGRKRKPVPVCYYQVSSRPQHFRNAGQVLAAVSAHTLLAALLVFQRAFTAIGGVSFLDLRDMGHGSAGLDRFVLVRLPFPRIRIHLHCLYLGRVGAQSGTGIRLPHERVPGASIRAGRHPANRFGPSRFCSPQGSAAVVCSPAVDHSGRSQQIPAVVGCGYSGRF